MSTLLCARSCSICFCGFSCWLVDLLNKNKLNSEECKKVKHLYFPPARDLHLGIPLQSQTIHQTTFFKSLSGMNKHPHFDILKSPTQSYTKASISQPVGSFSFYGSSGLTQTEATCHGQEDGGAGSSLVLFLHLFFLLQSPCASNCSWG